MKSINLKDIKVKFPIFKKYPELIYLDSAATSQKPQCVMDRIDMFYNSQNANIHRGIYDLSEIATAEYEKSRKVIAKLLGAKENEVVLTYGATHAANLTSMSFLKDFLEENDVIITTLFEHHSSFLPIQRIAKETKAKLKFVGLDEQKDFDYETFGSLCKEEKVKVVNIASISNVLGLKVDIKKISQTLKKHHPDAVLIVDAAQEIGHREIDFESLDIDFLYFSGHKVFGPTGIGALIGKTNLLRKMQPYLLGGGMVDQVGKSKSTFTNTPQGLEAGTPNIAGAIGLARALEFAYEDVGLKAIQAHEAELTQFLFEKLANIPEITTYGPQNLERRSSLVSFSIDKIHSHDVADFLNTRNIAVRAGHHCAQILHKDLLKVGSTARISLHLYNDKSDIDKAILAIKECIVFFKNI
jgi:cysteine desulfurase/selenocysteine lyase